MPALPHIDPTPVRADDIKSRWRRGEAPDAAAALRAHPSLARHKSFVVDLAYEEYCLREEAGEAPDAESFCGRFGLFRGSIRKVLDAHRLLADHPELLGAAPVEWPTAGATVEGLELIRELGRGAFGRAYLAFDPETNRPCVLKLAAGRSAEARVVGPLDHPHVTDVYWSRAVGGLTAVCMPLVGVTTLEDVRDAAFPASGAAAPPRADVILDTIEPVGRADAPVVRPGERYAVGVAAVAAAIADALRYLHARGVAHGDLKPSNVVLGAGGRPHLIDFNLAITKDAPRAAAGGTLPYMAPELLRVLTGEAPPETVVPERADLYAFGAMLFELLTGRVPCEPAGPDEPRSVADLLARRLQESCDARSFPPQTPPRLVRVVLRCLAPDPAARPADAAEVADDLVALVRELRTRRRRGLVAAAACGALALAGASWFALPEKPPPAAPAAQVAAEPATADEYFARGLQFLHAGQYPQALQDFTSANGIRRDCRSLAYLAYCLAVMGQHKMAVEQGIEATQHGAASAAVYNNIGYSLCRLNQYDRALRHLNKAIESDPSLREAYYNRAFTQHQINIQNSTHAPDLRAVRDIRKALQHGVLTPDVYCLAADICAHAVGHDRTLCDQAVMYVGEAIRRGIPLRHIQRSAILKRMLGDNPKFREALATPQETKEPIDSHFGLVEPAKP